MGRRAAVWLATCWLGLAVPVPLTAAQTSEGQVVVEVLGLHSGRGRVFAALFHGQAGFPNHVEQAFARMIAPIVDKRVRFAFEHIPAGDFAVSLFHDENNNAALDTNMFGMPKEGWGASRDAEGRFGPPSYGDARISLSPGEHKRIVVHVKY